MINLLRKAAFCLVVKGPFYLGSLAPHLFAFALGCKDYKRVR